MFSLAFLLVLCLPESLAYDNETMRYENGSIINFSSYCEDDADNPCGATVTCNMTMYYPNGSLMTNNQEMNALGAGIYNYSFGNLTLEGYYQGSIHCYDSTNNGTSPATLQVVDKLGGDNIFWQVGIMIGMIAILWFFYRMSTDLSEEHHFIKFLFVFGCFWLTIIIINLGLSIAAGENAASTVINNLTTGYKIVMYSSIFVVGYLVIYFLYKQVLERIPIT